MRTWNIAIAAACVICLCLALARSRRRVKTITKTTRPFVTSSPSPPTPMPTPIVEPLAAVTVGPTTLTTPLPVATPKPPANNSMLGSLKIADGFGSQDAVDRATLELAIDQMAIVVSTITTSALPVLYYMQALVEALESAMRTSVGSTVPVATVWTALASVPPPLAFGPPAVVRFSTIDGMWRETVVSTAAIEAMHAAFVTAQKNGVSPPRSVYV